MYNYTLARELVLLGNDVTIYSGTIGGIITEKAQEVGIKVVNQLPEEEFDIVSLNQKWSEHVLDKYTCPFIYTIHSEFPPEEPIRDERIKKYIAIRPSIAEKWGISCEIIYNPIDFQRFHPFPKPKEEMTLFVGTIDWLRFKSAAYLLNKGVNVRFVGEKFAIWANNLKEWYPATWDIEEHLKEATETAGVMLGRTTLEGFACGLPSTIFTVNESGAIIKVEKVNPPEDMQEFNSKLVAQKIFNIYKDLNGRRTETTSERMFKM
jgi:hypothetical protein